MIKYLYLFVFILNFLVASKCYSISYPEFVSIDEILKDKEVAKSYYEYLRFRFRNGDLDETIFIEDSSLKGPRLSVSSYDDMVATVRAYVEKYPEEKARLAEISQYNPIRIEKNGMVTRLTSEQLNSWKEIGTELGKISEKVNSLGFLKEYGSSELESISKFFSKELGIPFDNIVETFDAKSTKHLDALIISLQKQFNKKRNSQLLQDIADVLLTNESRVGRLDRLIYDKSIPPYAKYMALEDIEKSAKDQGRRLSVTGKVTDNLLSQSSMKEVPRTNLFRKGTALIPMTRMEAIFKGIGPGECVRSSCNRYIDAFYKDALHFKIAKGGEETGYVAVYKVKEKGGKRKFWFVETIQSPMQDSRAGSASNVRSILKELQQLAAKDDSLLVLPAKSYNSYNFKEVVAQLDNIPETKSGQKVTTELRHTDTIEQFDKFNKTGLSDLDQRIASASGYKKTITTNGLTFNQGSAIVVGSLLDQPDWILEKTPLLWEGKEVAHIDESFKLDPLKRADLVMKNSSSVAAKINLLSLVSSLKNKGQSDIAAEVMKKAYRQLPDEIQGLNFDEQYKYVKKQIEKVSMKASKALELKEELFLKASSWDDYMKIMELGDKTSSREFANFISSTINKFAHEASDTDLLKIYADNLRYMPDSNADFELTRGVGTHLKENDSFIQFVKYMRGEGISGSFTGDDLRNTYIAENWDRFFPNESNWTKRLEFAEFLFPRLGNRADYHVRFGMFDKVTELYQIEEIMKIQKLWKQLGKNRKIIFSSKIGDAIKNFFENRSIKDFVHGNNDLKLLEKYLMPGDKNKVYTSLIKKIKTIEDLTLLMKVGAIDERYLVHLLKEDIPDDLREKVSKIVANSLKENGMIKLKKYGGESVLHGYSIEDVKELEKIAKNKGFSAFHHYFDLSFNPNSINANDAKHFVLTIEFIQGLEISDQEQILNKLKDSRSYVLNELVPEHRELHSTLDKWERNLASNNIETEILDKRFKSGLTVRAVEGLSATKSRIKNCMSEVLSKLTSSTAK